MAKIKKRKRGGASVACPTCGMDTQVVITRRMEEDGTMVRRVRQCKRKHKFLTIEQVVPADKVKAKAA